jgi:hypothetical protein
MPKTESELGSRLLVSRLISPEQLAKSRAALDAIQAINSRR